jgi:hypothetical protein
LLGDGDEERCPYCRTRFGNHGRPLVLGESNKISARPVLPIEWDLPARVIAEKQTQERRRVAAMADGPPGRALPPSSLDEARSGATAPDRPRHRARRRRRIAPKSRIDTAPASPRSRFDAEAEAAEPELREPELREVVIPEVVFDDEPAASDPGSDAQQHLLSSSTGGPRVKKIRAKGRKGWVVDYVVPESEPASDDPAP